MPRCWLGGVYGQPEPPPPSGNSLTLNNVTIVPIERLTNEELDFCLALAEKGRAIPIDATATPNKAQRQRRESCLSAAGHVSAQ